MPQESACQPMPTRSPTLRGRDGGADGGDGADDLVAGDEGVFADAPVVVDQVDVGVADAAVGDFDFDIGGGQLARIVFEWQQMCTGRMRGQTMELTHLFCSLFSTRYVSGCANLVNATSARRGRLCIGVTLGGSDTSNRNVGVESFMSIRHLALFTAFALVLNARAQNPAPTPPPAAPNPPAAAPEEGPQTEQGPAIIKKKTAPAEAPPAAPDREKIKNPNGATYSMRVDVPIVSLDVNVILDKTHQFVPGLKPANFLVLEDGVEQEVQSVRMTQTPITAVMLLEFAANNYNLIYDMRNAAIGFFRSIRSNDYVAVITYDLHTHILTDFTNNTDVVAESLRSLTIPMFSDTNMFDALYETLDRTTRIEGRKYIILIGSGRDTFSKLTWDKMMKKIEATPNVTIFTIGTGGFMNEMSVGGGIRGMNVLQAQNQLKTIAAMTGGLYFDPIFQGALPDVFNQINDSIRNQYVLTYKPTNNKNDGSYRKVKVLLVDNEGKPLKMQDEKQKPLKYSVIARDGYKAKLPVE